MGRLVIAEDSDHIAHQWPGHPERPDRVEAIRQHLGGDASLAALPRLGLHSADDEALLRVHSREHVDAVMTVSRAGGGHFDVDTYATARSEAIARRAAGGAMAAVAAVVSGEADSAFAVVRPPGHHATVDHAMGFCLYNNVAVAVEHARATLGVRRAAVVDIDVHHGNGTEATYWSDPDVLYASLHQYPFYPETGPAEDRGGAGAQGATLNVPLPAGTDGAGWLQAFDSLVLPALADFNPELVVVSCGFDAHIDDPLANLGLTAATYGAVAERLCELRSEAGGRSAWVLEGGYNLGALVSSADTVVRTLMSA